MDDVHQLVWQGAAVGFTETDQLGAPLYGTVNAGQGIVPIGLEAVEEVFGVVEEMLDPLAQKGQGILNNFQVLF